MDINSFKQSQNYRWRTHAQSVWVSERDSVWGRQHPVSAAAGYHLWGHPRAVLRPEGAFQDRWTAAREQVTVPGRLGRPRLQFRWDANSFTLLQTQTPWWYHSFARQPRESSSNGNVWILYRNNAQVRQLQRVEVVHGSFRLHEPRCVSWRAHTLFTRRTQSSIEYNRPDAHTWPQNRDPAIWPLLWHHVERPRRLERGDLDEESTWSRVTIRLEGHRTVQRGQQHQSHCTRAPAGHGGIQVHVPAAQSRQRLECPQLLLTLRQCCFDYDHRWTRPV